MSWRKRGAGHITVHRPLQIEYPGAVDAAKCPTKSHLTQICARIESPEKSHSESEEKQCTDWLSKKYFTHLQAIAVLESSEVHDLCQPIYDTHESFVKELDKYLAYKDVLNLRKKELLYKKWNECVYQPMQWKLQSILTQSFERRRASILQYLDYCKKKEPVFLENYHEDDFNPFVQHLCKPQTLKTKTSTLNDPLLLQIRSKSEEDNVIQQCQEGTIYGLKESTFFWSKLPLFPLGRHNINSIAWLRVPLNYIESEVRQKSRKRMISETTKI
ncbi:protein FAM228A [Rhinoraja longicauda]